jgi:uncharacterized protein (TIGR02646 family)
VLEIKKPNKPDFFELWIKNNKEYGRQLREFMLEKEQINVCCYCEKGITDPNDSHIDHIRPQAKFPKLKHDYNNLVISCQTKGRCGKAKEDKFNEHFIVPTEANPEDYLTYSANGEIIPIDDNKKGTETIKAIETIDILKLNAPKLVGARRTLFIQLNQMRDSLDNFENWFKEYPTFIKYFKENYQV